MRIQLFQSKGLSSNEETFVNELQKALTSYPEVEIVDVCPELVHVFGAWNSDAEDAINAAYRHDIPIVYSTMGSLSPWTIQEQERKGHFHQITRMRMAVEKINLLHVIGPMEKLAVDKRKWLKGRCIVLPNPIVSSLKSFEEIARSFVSEYIHIIGDWENQTRGNILRTLQELKQSDDAIREICSKTLYLHHWNHREALPLHLLEELGDYLTTNDYDEEEFSVIIDKIGMSSFFCRLEKVLAERGLLTEGFMPTQPLHDKETDAMTERIIEMCR